MVNTVDPDRMLHSGKYNKQFPRDFGPQTQRRPFRKTLTSGSGLDDMSWFNYWFSFALAHGGIGHEYSSLLSPDVSRRVLLKWVRPFVRPSIRPSVRLSVRPPVLSYARRHNEMGSLWTQLLFQFLTDLFETLQVWQTACLIVNPIIVDGYASLFNCTTAVRASDSMTASS